MIYSLPIEALQWFVAFIAIALFIPPVYLHSTSRNSQTSRLLLIGATLLWMGFGLFSVPFFLTRDLGIIHKSFIIGDFMQHVGMWFMVALFGRIALKETRQALRRGILIFYGLTGVLSYTLLTAQALNNELFFISAENNLSYTYEGLAVFIYGLHVTSLGLLGGYFLYYTKQAQTLRGKVRTFTLGATVAILSLSITAQYWSGYFTEGLVGGATPENVFSYVAFFVANLCLLGWALWDRKQSA